MDDFLAPEKIIREIPSKEEMSVADFGCGAGGITIPLAKKCKDAKIYAIDILSEALSALRSRAELEKVYNIRTLRADLEKGTELQENFFDLVIVSNILFQADDKEAVLKEAYRVLRDGGQLFVVDWKMENDKAEEKIKEGAENEGFKLLREVDAGKDHFGRIYEKK